MSPPQVATGSPNKGSNNFPMAKPRSDSKLLNLPPEAQERIYVWLTEGVGDESSTSYAAVREQIYLDYSLRVSKSALALFWQKVVAPRRLRLASEAAKGFTSVARGLGTNFEEAALAACQQKAFEILASEDPDPKDIFALFGSVLDAQKIALKREELSLKKDVFEVKTCELFLKWFKDEKAREIANSPVTNTEKIAQLRAAYFADVDALDQSGKVIIPE